MAYSIKITYTGKQTDVEQVAASICPIMLPNTSYADSPVFKEGYEVDAEAEDKKYGKSVYATNVEGFGSIEAPEPFKTTSFPFPVPLAQFKVAVIADAKDEHGNPYVEIETDDYKEALYYKEAGVKLADQGFEVVVTKK